MPLATGVMWVLASCLVITTGVSGTPTTSHNWPALYRIFAHQEPIATRVGLSSAESRKQVKESDVKEVPKVEEPLDKKCYSRGLVPWPPGQIDASNGTCYLLAAQGPCPDGQWLILNPAAPGPIPECRPHPCPREDLYLWRGSKCVGRDSQSRLCPDNAWLVNDVFGHATCVCRPMPPHALWPKDQSCYPLYSQGPCAQGQHFVPDYSRRLKKSFPEAVGRCKVNPCVVQSLVLWRDGTCQRWNQSNRVCDTGIEGQSSFLGVDPDTLLPNCTEGISITYGVRLPTRRCDNGQLDQLGICRRSFEGAYLPYGTFLTSLYNRSNAADQQDYEDEEDLPDPVTDADTDTFQVSEQ